MRDFLIEAACPVCGFPDVEVEVSASLTAHNCLLCQGQTKAVNHEPELRNPVRAAVAQHLAAEMTALYRAMTDEQRQAMHLFLYSTWDETEATIRQHLNAWKTTSTQRSAQAGL